MKVTKEQAAANRAALVKAAGRLFRERGMDGVGVAEISKAAGLTHGALYAQFSSKEALAAEALSEGFERSFEWMRATVGKGGGLSDYLDFLLSPEQRDDMGRSCPLTASASEIARRDAEVSERFAEGYSRMADTIEAALGETSASDDARHRALTIVAAEIGAIAVARAIRQARPALSDEVLSAARCILGEIGDPYGNRTRVSAVRGPRPDR